MANLNDILARLAPCDVDGIAVLWELDHGGDWIEIVGWFSPGVKFGEPRHQVPFRHSVKRSGDPDADIGACVTAVIRAVRERLRPPEKRRPGRPKKIAA